MASVLASPLAPAPQDPARIVLDGVSWDQYVQVSDALTPQHGLRLTYDGRRLEFMTLSYLHEHFGHLLGRIIEMLAFELGIELEGGGSTTFRHEDVERGLEADECYWVAHAAEMIDVREWDPEIHPPPDLAVEIDITSSSLNRREIYARLRVPELWRFDGQSLQAFRLAETGEYVPIEMSLAFPFLRVSDLEAFLVAREGESETQTIRRFVDWVRKQGFQSE